MRSAYLGQGQTHSAHRSLDLKQQSGRCLPLTFLRAAMASMESFEAALTYHLAAEKRSWNAQDKAAPNL